MKLPAECSDILESMRGLGASAILDAAREIGVGGSIGGLRPQSGPTRFAGWARTATLHYEPWRDIPLADYGGWRLHGSTGPGDVAVLDGGGLRFTMMGELAGTNLRRRGAVAAAINGCIRDLEALDQIGLSVFARDAGIVSAAGHAFVRDVGAPIVIEGVVIATGDFIAGCRGGLVVVPRKDCLAVLALARERQHSRKND